MSNQPRQTPRPARRRRRRVVLLVLGGLLAVLVLLVVLAPAIVGALAPSRAAKAISASINGTATVDRVSLSWFGRQRVGPVTVTNARGEQVAALEIELGRGLWGLARAGLGVDAMNLGEARVSGTVTIVRYPDGSTNAEEVLGKPGPKPAKKPSEPAKLPEGLTATLVVDGLDFRFIDQTAPAGAPAAVTRIPNLSGTASITEAKQAAMDLSGEVFYGSTPDSATQRGGSISVVGTADSLTDAQGVLTPEQAVIDAKVQVKEVAVAIADTLAKMENRLVAGLGEQLQATIQARGTMANAEASITANSRGLNADIALRSADGVLTAARPGSVRLQGASLEPLVPAIGQALAQGEKVRMDRLPDVALELESLRVKLPIDGAPLDLRGASVALGLRTGEAAGQVSIPAPGGGGGAGGGAAGPMQPFTVSPATLRLESADLSERITLTGSAAARLNGRSAGTLAIDLAAIQPVDSAGKPQPDLERRIRGTANLTGVATAIAQPFAEAAGIDLAADVGPQLDIAIAAEGAGEAAAGAPGPTRLAADIKSANINGAARLLLDGRTLRTQEQGITLNVGTVGPLATRRLRDAGVTVESGGSLALAATDVAVDLDRLSGPAGTDLRAIAGVVRVETSAAAGRWTRPGDQPRAWELAPLMATVNAADLARGVTLKATTSARLDGEAAGNLGVDLAASNLVGPDGAPAATLPAINGRIAISGISTTLAQPWVESAGLNLPAGVGPRLDVVLAAASRGGATAAEQPPATDLDLTIRSAGVSGGAALAFDGRTIRRRGDTQISVRSPGTLAGGALRKSGVTVSEGGYVTAVAREYAVEFDDKWRPQWGRSQAQIELTTGGFAVAPAPVEGQTQPADPVSLNQLAAVASLAPGSAPAVTLRGSGAHRQAAFALQGQLDLPGLIAPDGALTPGAARPLGTVEITNLPTTLAALAVPAPASPAPGERPGLDLAELLRSAAGPTVSVKLDAAPLQGGAPDARDVALRITSAGVNGQAAAAITQDALAIRTVDFRAAVSPALAATLIDAAGPGLTSRPNLAGPAMLTLQVSPMTVPLKGLTPDFRGAGDASLKVGLEGRTIINNVQLAGEDGRPRDIGPIGLENILLSASVPLGSLGAGGEAKPAEARLSGAILGANEAPIASIQGDGRVVLAAGGPASNLDAKLKVDVRDAAWIDTFLGQPALVAGSVGQTLALDAAAAVEFEKPASPETPSFAYRQIAVTASVASPLMATTQPLRATVVPASISVQTPMVVRWSLEPAWANRYLFANAGAEAGKTDILRLTAPAEVNLSLFRLALATAPGQGPMMPGVFAADAEITAPRMDLTVGPPGREVKTAVQALRTRVIGGKEPGTLGFSLSIEDAGGGKAAGGGPAVQFAGGLYGVADEAGTPTFDTAKLTANGTAASIPTVLIDALGKQEGLLIEALGPTASVDVKAQGLSKTSGNVQLTATSPRTEARLNGSIAGGVFTLAGTQQVATLKVVTPELGAMLVKGLPQLATVEKRPEDGPATVTVTNLRVPIDGDWSKLSGTMVLDLAQARFQTSRVFGQLLKLAGQQTAATAGRRLEAITLTAKDGIVSYDRINIPLGEFTLGTRGAVDLVGKRMDVLTFIPFGALTDEAAGLFNTDLGKLLGGALPTLEQATMVPFRTTGSFADPQTKPDMELFVKETGRTLLRPDKLIGGSLQDLLEKIGGDKDKKP